LSDKNKSYNFSDYFNLKITRDKLIDYFDYCFRNKALLFENIKPFEDIESLNEHIINMRNRIMFDSEIARREFLIAPLLSRLMLDFKNLDLSVEEKIEYNNLLKGKLDYLLSTENRLLILEAKNENMDSGLNQLIVEMITLDKIVEKDKIETDFIYGILSTGIEWQFIILDREKKEFISDSELYILPRDLEKILGIFVKILKLEKEN